MSYLSVGQSAQTPQIGIAILSKQAPDSWDQDYYGNFHEVTEYLKDPSKMRWHTALLVATFGEYCIATTHLTWTPNAQANIEQEMSIERLILTAAKHPELILCGDFNAPRGRDSFATLAAHYTDNIPSEITTSIDGSLHRAGALELMVDGIFSTPGYEVSDVYLFTGISDHCALLATISLSQ
jgi:endonuclease/exonuclease/phosphatase family metal-dependent hydrolase